MTIPCRFCHCIFNVFFYFPLFCFALLCIDGVGYYCCFILCVLEHQCTTSNVFWYVSIFVNISFCMWCCDVFVFFFFCSSTQFWYFRQSNTHGISSGCVGEFVYTDLERQTMIKANFVAVCVGNVKKAKSFMFRRWAPSSENGLHGAWKHFLRNLNVYKSLQRLINLHSVICFSIELDFFIKCLWMICKTLNCQLCMIICF